MSRRAPWCVGPARRPATGSGSPARSAMARWAWRWRRAGWPIRPVTCWTATVCRSRALVSRSPASPRPGWMYPTGWCRTLAIFAGPAGWRPRCSPGQVPLSDAARAAGPDWLATCLTGGDDYELLLAVPPAHSDALRRRLPNARASRSLGSDTSIPDRPRSWCARPAENLLL